MTRLLAIRQVSYALRLTSRRRALFGDRAQTDRDLVAARRRPSRVSRSAAAAPVTTTHVTLDVRSAQSNQFDHWLLLLAANCARKPRMIFTLPPPTVGSRRYDASTVATSRCRRQIMILFPGGGGKAETRARPAHYATEIGELLGSCYCRRRRRQRHFTAKTGNSRTTDRRTATLRLRDDGN